MKFDDIVKSLREFEKKNRILFSEMSRRQSAVLELSAVAGVQAHYVSNGFNVNFENLYSGSEFRVKTSTQGHPWNYSHVYLERGHLSAELHMNLIVQGAHDDGRYCVDVAVVKSGIVPQERPSKKWISLKNSDLISFVEVKRLIVYPMLLAHFIGIVHEISPKFLSKRKVNNVDRNRHIPPTLISLGSFSSNSREIVENYHNRNIQINIVENFDIRLACFRRKSTNTPLYW